MPIPRLLTSARDTVPETAIAAARLHFLDALAVGLAASRVGPVTGLPALAARQGSGPSTVLGSRATAPAPIAALINGGLIHSLEYDDTHVASVVHGSAVVAPAALAVAEEAGSSGRELLAAFAVGWEFLVRIGLASPGRIQAQGFQITSAAGAFAAAAVSCLLRDDDDDVLGNAVGIAGSQAAGTFAFLADGATVKAVQPAWAAHAGLLAAELARAGVTGPAGVFDGPFGFFTLYAKDPDGGAQLARELGDLGQVWHLPAAAFKLQPCCHYIHPFIEALHELMAQGVTVGSLASLHCWVPSEVVSVIAEPWAERQSPATAHAARWSLPFVLAAVLRDGAVGLDLFAGEVDEDLIPLSQRITFEPWPGSGFPSRFPARLRATLTDGSVIEVAVDDVQGSATRPVPADRVLGKVERNLAAGGLSVASAQSLVHEIVEAPEPDLRLVGDLLRSQPTGP
jgi:2-methylcitrate dehydratase PrpD